MPRSTASRLKTIHRETVSATKAHKARSDGSANQPTRPQPIWGSISDPQNQIRLQSTREPRTVRASTGESASWAHDGQSPTHYINR
jgi:hypothetical protein